MHHTSKGNRGTTESTDIAPRTPRLQDDTVQPARRIPGELGMWVFFFTDLMMFSAYFGAFMYERGNNLQEFSDGRSAMRTDFGLANTFLLLTASLLIALAVSAVRDSAVRPARGLLLGAGACGVAFVVNKGFEWSAEAAAGHTPQSSIFFQMYYVLTGIHLLHVVIAMVVIVLMWRLLRCVEGEPGSQQVQFLENGATFWHLTDALWIVLFTLFYLVR
ncbi:cytochrome c oxidase subunit 3 [Streptomyces microflavus]|uniref:cytochrome c oxidase subunit 3 n=1 Tax=Streptomyces microflavus TaxID=1919 RepID=UPI0022533F7E|nr:cytochrome c oxidase subunit 3 [Streptomyces microflavus]MCX4657228.1 cytochrome c oxidase subunit 3 [Streptomyces microflavus]